ncbi:MAG: hypothetical protein NT138_01610 [Planctomycetales bacterium]|nr:hypothetical protein [Planctomycetales bacterium]
MSDFLFEIALTNVPGIRFDAMLGDIFFLVLREPRDVRRLRAACLEIARCAVGKDVRHVVLILQDPAISQAKLQTEWDGLKSILKPEILERLSVIVSKEHELQSTLGDVPAAAKKHFQYVVEHASNRSTRPSGRTSDAITDVLRVLLIHWFRKACPTKLKELGEQTGFSYPSIAEALVQLQPWLFRFSDRSVSLRSFPQEEWFKLLARSGDVRSTQGFAVANGHSRPTELLMDKLRDLRPPGVAVGGTFGTRHYCPAFDLIGNPRLDLIVDARMQKNVPAIIRKLDPGLKPVPRRELPQVAVHVLFRKEMFFTSSDVGLSWADEVECLLDLHESRMESQAMEFLAFLKQRTKV